MNLNGRLDKEVDLQNIRCRYLEMGIVDVNPCVRYYTFGKSRDFCRFSWTPHFPTLGLSTIQNSDKSGIPMIAVWL